jgi:hypothetical protein
VDVDLGQDVVKDQVLELLFIADIVVDRAGDDPQAGGQAAHGQGLDAVVRDDRQRLGDHPLAGEPGAAVLVVDGRVEPQRVCPAVGRSCAGCGRCSRVGSRPLPLVHAASLNVGLDR